MLVLEARSAVFELARPSISLVEVGALSEIIIIRDTGGERGEGVTHTGEGGGRGDKGRGGEGWGRGGGAVFVVWLGLALLNLAWLGVAWLYLTPVWYGLAWLSSERGRGRGGGRGGISAVGGGGAVAPKARVRIVTSGVDCSQIIRRHG